MTKTTIHPYLDLLTISDEMDGTTAPPCPLVDALPTPPLRPGRPDRSRHHSLVAMAAIGVAAVAGFAAGWGLRALPAPHIPAEPVAARAVASAEPGPSPWACNLRVGGAIDIRSAVDACLAHTGVSVPEDPRAWFFSPIAAVGMP